MATKRTRTALSNVYQGRDPQDFVDDLMVSLSGVNSSGTADPIYVSPVGNDSNEGSVTWPYATISKALTEAEEGSVIVVLPGTYNENLTWPTENTVRLIGLGQRGAVNVTDTSDGGTAVLNVTPGGSYGAGSAFGGYVQDVRFTHEGTGLYLDTEAAAGPVNFYVRDCDFIQSGGTSVLVAADGAGTGVTMSIEGNPAQAFGPVYLDVDHADDQFAFYGMRLTGGLETSADAVDAEITLASCEVLHEGVSGGTAAQDINTIFCWSRTGETYALLDTNDLAGSHTENIIGS